MTDGLCALEVVVQHYYRIRIFIKNSHISTGNVFRKKLFMLEETECMESLNSISHLTKAKFLQKQGTKTPVFVRFSNFIGSKGSKDTAIDIRGFATKFYTEEGNYDMLALSFAIFSIMDAMKFSDFVHAVKPHAQPDVPQATVAHDHAWDYIANNQEI